MPLYRLFFFLLFCACVSLTRPVHAAKYCITRDELNALELRALMTHFEVAALSCSNAQDSYKRLVSTLEPTLKHNADTLRSFFSRMSMPKGLDQFVTSFANHASLLSTYDRAHFCRKQRALMSDLQSLDTDQLSGFSELHSLVTLYEPPLCSPS